MEQIKILKEVKFWPSVGKWCVSVVLPDYEFWGENGWSKDITKAEQIAMEHVRKHIAFIREMRAHGEKSELVVAM